MEGRKIKLYTKYPFNRNRRELTDEEFKLIQECQFPYYFKSRRGLYIVDMLNTVSFNGVSVFSGETIHDSYNFIKKELEVEAKISNRKIIEDIEPKGLFSELKKANRKPMLEQLNK